MAFIHRAKCEIPGCGEGAEFEIPQFFSPLRGGFEKLWVCEGCKDLSDKEILGHGIVVSHLFDAFHDPKTGKVKRTPKSLERAKEKARKAEVAEERHRRRYEEQFS